MAERGGEAVENTETTYAGCMVVRGVVKLVGVVCLSNDDDDVDDAIPRWILWDRLV